MTHPLIADLKAVCAKEKSTAAAPTCQPAERGLTLPCPQCGEADATISLNLADMESLTCNECSAEFTALDVQRFIAKWAPVLAWIGSAPTAQAE